ncbi:cation-translocating P-type ATPase [Ezakiella peruensis]|uniref:cation-translocating P-type ATPase n=1 Tax=Ezakiella peruensis TaxID=1464038 RepID=UPI000C1B4897|nr:cation-translocating P-type ATPase [Ezakiella peruensis]
MYHNQRSIDVLKEFDSMASDGLSTVEAKERLEKYGLNEFQDKKRKTFLQKFIDQFKDFMIIILIVAAIISIAAGERVDAIVILAIVILNAFLSIYQEGQAEKSLESLKQMSAPEAKVIRDGKKTVVPARELVPGDIVILEAGDIIPADLRLFTSSNLKVDESSLTGESVAVEKNSEAILDNNATLGDRVNMAYMSTIVTYGRGKGVVVGTSHDTEIGKIATMIEEIEDDLTPLQNKLDKLGKKLGILTIIICAIVFALGLIQKREVIDMLLVSVSLAVAAIPEGLPAIVTIVLAIGMGRMVKKNAIVKKLLAVETLGSTTYICSDKTGTLTQNEMTVKKVYSDGKYYDVTGTGYEPEGQILNKGNELTHDELNNLKALLYACILNNDANLLENNNVYTIMGDPTEGALITFAGKAGFLEDEVEAEQPRIDEIPFDSDRKMMSTFHEVDNRVIQYTKGAPDIVLSNCRYIYIDGEFKEITDEQIADILKANSTFASDALRVLGFAIKIFDKDDFKNTDKNEEDLIFIGLTGMIDPPRTEAMQAIKECKRAGIHTVMITGDHRETAFQIAKELGICENHNETISGSELSTIADSEYNELVKKIKVYSRVSPEQKVKIVNALRENGEIVAMTGDGVNDALAIKRADIGISMGITGTDVAKNTADMVLTDDNFASIVNAVEEGRIIFANIQKFVAFLLSCNIGEILIVFFAMLLGMEEPLKPIHLLWLNLVTDSLPALALGVEPGEPGIMDEKPRSKDDPIITKKMGVAIVLQSLAITVASLLAFYYARKLYPDSITHARTIVFATLITSELLRAFSSRSFDRPIWKIGIKSNMKMVYAILISFLMLIAVLYIPFLHDIFDTFQLGFKDWEIVLSFAFIPFIIGELVKLVRNVKQ